MGESEGQIRCQDASGDNRDNHNDDDTVNATSGAVACTSESGNTKSHSTEKSLWKWLRTCRKTDYGMDE